MKAVFLLLVNALLLAHFTGYSQTSGTKSDSTALRVVISSDFPPIDVCMSGCAANRTSDPDDVQSMVRFLLYTNEFKVEGLIASSGTFANVAKKQNILDMINLYDKVDENLRSQDSRYPAADYLRSITFQGRSGTWGGTVSKNIGAGKDSEASDSIISIVDKPDPRPVWFCFWGDCSNLAQAIWKVQNKRSAAELQTFLSKIRIFQIAHQDSTIDWLLNNFPDLFIIYSESTYMGIFGGPKDPLGNLTWLNSNVRQNHGPLGAVYPKAAMSVDGLKEGDTPSFLYLVSAAHGMNNPEDPTQESWGGQYKRAGNTNHWVDGPGAESISKWKSQYQAEFAKCADWMLRPSTGTAPLKARMVVLTDISSWETDDQESLTRLLVHADLFEIEGIVVTTGWSISDVNGVKQFMDIAQGVINAYEKDLPNLLRRSKQSGHSSDNTNQTIGYWPGADYLRNKTMFGSMKRGNKFIGKGNDSKGSQLIIDLADENDDRPIWITVWGGANTLAQAIWKIQQIRSEEELKAFLHKLRVYTITDQDRAYDGSEGYEISSHQWMRKEFEKDLLFIWDERAWLYQNYAGGKDHWSDYETYIQNHGNLGSQYPKYINGVEGDTPAFLHLLPNGLNDPSIPTQAGWGGYNEWGLCADNQTYAYTNNTGLPKTICDNYEAYFYPATFNNFAARMDWAKDGAGNRNPVVVIDGDNSFDIITKTPPPGEAINLDASATSDPDSDSLTFKWWIQPEAGTYPGKVTISNSNSSVASFIVPSNSLGKSIHVICEVTDNGMPNLTSYRRIIFEPIVGVKPVVSITSPTNGSTFAEQANITITADASDSDGKITSVEFFQVSKSIGTVNKKPYSISWDNVAANNYTLTARVTDNDGNVTTSEPVSIIVKKTTGVKKKIK